MATIKPFAAIRPNVKYVNEVAALPYDVMSSEEARNMTANNPYSFLHVDKAEIDLDASVDPYSAVVYETAKKNLLKMINDRILVRDQKPLYYIYQLEMDGRIQTGLVFCASIDEYLDNTIKKHEHTRENKEQDRIRHVDTCNANTGPIFLTYPDRSEITGLIQAWCDGHEPVYDFVSDDHIRHTVWTIDQNESIFTLTQAFKKVSSLYIADGHHRNASAVKVGLNRRSANPNYSGEEEYNYFLAVAFPASELHILDYNRVVKDLNGMSWDAFLKKISKDFIISAPSDEPVRPYHPHSFGMYGNKQWYTITFQPTEKKELSVVENLDVSVLQNYLLSPILGIQDPRTDNRIKFVGGIRGLTTLQSLVDTGGYAVAFSMFPTSIQEVMSIADDNKVMPPKSTWFEPKLRSGLFIHELS